MKSFAPGQFPTIRPRRLRQSPALRRLVSETRLSPQQLILPLFVRPGKRQRKPIGAMPGVFQLSVDELLKDTEKAIDAGVPAVILFGIPEEKDSKASGAYAENGIVQREITFSKNVMRFYFLKLAETFLLLRSSPTKSRAVF